MGKIAKKIVDPLDVIGKVMGSGGAASNLDDPLKRGGGGKSYSQSDRDEALRRKKQRRAPVGNVLNQADTLG